MTIKISQLGNLATFSDSVLFPVVANVSGNLTTVKSDGITVKTYVLGTLATDQANTAANVATLQSNVSTLQSNVSTLQSNVSTLQSNVSTLQSNVSTLQSAGYITATYLQSITGNVVPSANVTYDLGSNANRWRDLYLSGTTIYLGNTTINAQTFTDLSANVSTLQNNAAATGSNVSVLQSDVTTINGHLSATDGNVATLQGNIASISPVVASTESNVTILQSTVGNLQLSQYLTIATYANATPANATATGTKGDITYDATYVYLCVATDTWVRVLRNAW